MKAGLYYPWLYLKSGGERTIAALIRHSRHDWTIYTNRYDAEATFPELRSAHIVELPRVSVRRSVDDVLGAAWQIARQKLPLHEERVLLVVCEGLGDFITFRNRRVVTACLCLTPLRAAFDPHYQTGYLAMHGNAPLRRMLLGALAPGFRMVDRAAWRRYAHAFAISREVKTRIVLGGLRPRNPAIEMAYPGVDADALVPSWRYDSYFLLPGRIMWTKNIELGIEAFARFRQQHPAYAHFRFVVAGYVDAKSEPYLARLRALAAPAGHIDFVVSPSDAELLRLYRSAYAIVYTPFNEDWGLTPLEGMAHGKAVVAVDRGGPRETVRDQETGFLMPASAERFAECMARLAGSPEMTERMGRAAHAHARQYDTRAFVRIIDDRLDALVPSAAGETTEAGVLTQTAG